MCLLDFSSFLGRGLDWNHPSLGHQMCTLIVWCRSLLQTSLM